MKNSETEKQRYRIASENDLNEGLTRLTIDKKELVIVKRGKSVVVFAGECMHDGALLAHGFIEGDFLTCGKHLWRYHLETGVLDKEPDMGLKKFDLWREEGELYIDLNELEELADPDDEYDDDL